MIINNRKRSLAHFLPIQFLPFISDSLTGGAIVGDMAPYQAFAVGGLGSVRGYGEGGVGVGRSCLVANNELTLPLVSVLLAIHFSFSSWKPEKVLT